MRRIHNTVSWLKNVEIVKNCTQEVWWLQQRYAHALCRYECAFPVWSCAWNTDDRKYFYAGLQNGTVLVFDIRKLSEPVMTLNQDTGSRSPAVSVQYMPATSGSLVRYDCSRSIDYSCPELCDRPGFLFFSVHHCFMWIDIYIRTSYSRLFLTFHSVWNIILQHCYNVVIRSHHPAHVIMRTTLYWNERCT